MSSTTTERVKNFKSKIPVPVFKVNSLIEPENRREIGKKFTSKPEASSNKSNKNSIPLLSKNCKTQLVKPLSKKNYERNEVRKNQPFSSQSSNKKFVKNCIASKKQKEKSLLFKENKPSNKANKDISIEFKKVAVKNSVKGEPKKAKPVADEKYKTSNDSLPVSNFRDIQIKNENKLHESQNILEKENKEKFMTSDFSAQKGIKFESNEIYRQMILRGRELSPSVLKLAPGVKLSSVISRRPSAFDKVFEAHPDPHKHAIEAIEKLSAKMAAIPTGYRKLSTQFEKLPLSPYKMRYSLYTPGINPEEKVMKSLEAIKAKRMQKSALKSAHKKVTFNFNIEEFSPKVESSSEQRSVADPEDKLAQISERNSENTPFFHLRNQCDTHDNEKESFFKSSKFENSNEFKPSKTESLNSESTEQGACLCTISSQSGKDFEMNNLAKKYQNIPRLGERNNLLIADCSKSPISCSKKISSASLYRNKNFDQAFRCQRIVSQILPNCIDQGKQRTNKMKLCTPRPVSFYSNSRLLHNCSPDFLEDRNLENLSNLAPIYTPLVLKNIAKCSSESPDNLSPVKLKLDFAAAENDTPRKEISGKMQVPSVKDIVTGTKKLDNLADKECDIFLSNEKCPVLCGRYLHNPVALTLTEGDEMHFVPIRL